jgi:pimeloyl-ACP methyl ester carboxylesterase
MAKPVAESVVSVRGARLQMRRAGAGQPMLYLHGSQGLSEWLPCFDALAERFEVLAPDHPGFGRSDDPGMIDRIADLANFYLDAIDTLGLDRIHVVGHEIGAWVALEMALRSPKIASLSLIGTAGLHVDGVQKGDFFIARPDEWPALFFTDVGIGQRFFDTAFAGQDAAIPHRNRMMAARLAWHPRLIDPHFGKWLHRVKVPTHFIWGEGDRIIPPATAAGFMKRIGQANLSTIAGAGHFPQIERPDAFVAALLAALLK